MTKNVLLVNGIGTTGGDERNSPSISLMALSAFLRQNGYTSLFISRQMNDQELSHYLKDSTVVGFSVYTGVGISQALNLSKRIRNLSPKIPLVWGGYHATLEPDQTLRHNLVDYVIRGEGEFTFLELLNFLSGDPSVKIQSILGLSHKKDGHIYHNPTRPACELETLPLADYHLYHDFFTKSDYLYYLSSRGCPFTCKFCCNAAFNREHGLKFRQLSVGRIIEDLKQLVSEYTPNEISFMDDLFLAAPQRVSRFLDGYQQNGFGFKWTAFGRCDTVIKFDQQLMHRMKKAGLKKIFFGVESGSQRVLDFLGKKLKVQDVIDCAEKLADADIEADFTFINGFPHESEDDVLASLDLRTRLLSISPRFTSRFFVYTPFPGADLVAECQKAGYVAPRDLEGWFEFEFHAFSAPWLPAHHKRWIKNIAYASMFEGMAPAALSSGRDFVLWWLSKISRWRLTRRRLHWAPELGLLARIHQKRLARSSH